MGYWNTIFDFSFPASFISLVHKMGTRERVMKFILGFQNVMLPHKGRLRKRNCENICSTFLEKSLLMVYVIVLWRMVKAVK
jgi:hypothetical protein